MNIFLVHIPFLIGHLPPVNSLFQKKSVLKNLIHIDATYFFTISKIFHAKTFQSPTVPVSDEKLTPILYSLRGSEAYSAA